MTFVLLVRVLGGWMVLRRRHPRGCVCEIVAGPFATKEEAESHL
jgi:hypothetical protein